MLLRAFRWPLVPARPKPPSPTLLPRRLLPSASSPAFSRQLSLQTTQRPARPSLVAPIQLRIPCRHAATVAAPSRPPSSPQPHTPRQSRETKPQRNLFNLRPYQQECVDAVLDELKKGEHSRLGVSSPTGASLSSRIDCLQRPFPTPVEPICYPSRLIRFRELTET